MGTAPAFGDLLDRKLGGPEPPSSDGATSDGRPATFAWVDPLRTFTFAPATRAGCATRAYSGGLPPATRRSPRRLSPAQRAALDTLRSLGSLVQADCTSSELKRAIRTLAKRYHPDRHPAAAPAERQWLASCFHRAWQAYTTLLPATHGPDDAAA